jgi:hypothetical protein
VEGDSMNKLTCLSLIKRASNGNGGGSGTKKVEEKQIIFIDYDGTILYSYTPEEVLALTELPSHESTDPLLIFDGWNWTLDELKDEINLIGLDFMQDHKMAIGAIYNTVDNATYLFISLDSEVSALRKISMYMFVPKGSSGRIDWGDGTVEDLTQDSNSSSSRTHQYEECGDYVIKIIADFSGGGGLGNSYTASSIFSAYIGDSYAGNILRKAYIGAIPRLYYGLFSGARNLRAVSISNKCKSIGRSMFCDSHSLKSISYPRNMNVSTSSLRAAMRACRSLKYISLPKKNLNIESSVAGECGALTYAHIPSKSICTGGSYGFAFCYSLHTIVLPNIDNTATEMAHTCSSIRKAIIIGESCSLKSTFEECINVSRIKIKSPITSIGSGTFKGCYNLEELDLTACESVPTLESTGAFSYVNSFCKILVPAALAEEWKAATNWSSFANQIVAVEV